MKIVKGIPNIQRILRDRENAAISKVFNPGGGGTPI